MSTPSFSVVSESTSSKDAIVVLGLIDVDGKAHVYGDSSGSHLQSAVEAIRASAKLESVCRIPDTESASGAVALVGLGATPPSIESLRSAAGAITRTMTGAKELVFKIPASTEAEAVGLLEGALLGCYTFDRYKSSPQKIDEKLQHITVVTSVEVSEQALDRVRAKVSALSLIKDLVNTPASDLTPEIFTHEALRSLDGLDVSSKVWDEKQLREEGFGGLVGVGQGSTNPPRLLRIDYAPEGAQKHVSLVGKGITFDTGGLTLKSAAGMVGMKYDMTGAATALAVIRAVAALKAQIHVTAWLCLAENMPSATATKPNDILTIRNGKTVEVLNTDAEGRLVLADGLSAASEEHPDLIIDIATLTGAARGALGTRTVGAMGNSTDLSRLVESAQSSGEQFWRMPLPSELRTLLNSDIADMINGRPGNTTAGMLLAGVFLSEFVGEIKDSNPPAPIPWIHLDIAGTADNPGSAYGFTSAGPTGVTARALIDFILAGA